VRLGIDWGVARVGVAACDPDGLLAYPVETVPARDQAAALSRVVALARQFDAIELVMGLPLALNGRPEIAAESVLARADQLAQYVKIPVRLVDERLTSAEANRRLSALSGQRRRKVVDQAAAAGILEVTLAHERFTGTPPGRVIGDFITEGDA